MRKIGIVNPGIMSLLPYTGVYIIPVQYMSTQIQPTNREYVYSSPPIILQYNCKRRNQTHGAEEQIRRASMFCYGSNAKKQYLIKSVFSFIRVRLEVLERNFRSGVTFFFIFFHTPPPAPSSYLQDFFVRISTFHSFLNPQHHLTDCSPPNFHKLRMVLPRRRRRERLGIPFSRATKNIEKLLSLSRKKKTNHRNFFLFFFTHHL